MGSVAERVGRRLFATEEERVAAVSAEATSEQEGEATLSLSGIIFIGGRGKVIAAV